MSGMATYHIYRLKEEQRQRLRWAPHTSGASGVKPKDYEKTDPVEAAGVYAVWARLKDGDQALQIGDLLESDGGQLFICKYVGFEEARWVLPELNAGKESAPVCGSG